jgi:cytochrome P450
MLSLLTEQAYTVQMGVKRLVGKTLFLVNAPDTVREVMGERVRDFPKHRYLAEILQPLIGTSLFNANGEVWQQQRRLVDQAFSQAGMRRTFPLMVAAISDFLQHCDQTADGQPWEADKAMSGVTADIIFRTILSTPLPPEHAQQVHQAFRRYQESAQRVMGLGTLHLPTFFHFARCKRQGQAIRLAYAGLIHARYAATERGDPDLPQDMLAALLAARDPDSGARLSADEAVDQVSTLFLAGHETSASTLAWALYLLACQPALQDSLRAEVAAAWGEREPVYGETHQLSGVHAVLRETLRLYPPIAVYVRQAQTDTTLRGKPVRAGEMVVVSPWVVHRHRAHWEQPDEFDPQRFDTDAGRVALKTAYLPFGLGPRACPGAAFATQESVLILAQMLRRYRIETVAGQEPQPTARLTLRSANGVQLRLKRLNAP